MVKRIAVIVLETLSAGEAANVAALLTGQIAGSEPGFFSSAPVLDESGAKHAAPIFSVVVLKAKNASQLTKVVEHYPEMTMCFTRIGQELNNAFDEYVRCLSAMSISPENVVGVGVFGDEALVRAASRKFSLLK